MCKNRIRQFLQTAVGTEISIDWTKAHKELTNFNEIYTEYLTKLNNTANKKSFKVQRTKLYIFWKHDLLDRPSEKLKHDRK